jgi:PleD family two-component response regulator
MDRAPLHILLINDDEDDTFILHEVAQRFPTIELDNIHPQEKITEELRKGNMPDIILLDLYMSKMSGFDILRQLRSTKDCKQIPVIIYSSKQHSNIVKKCFDLGANMFIEKPHTYKGIERMIRKIVAMDWSRGSRLREHGFILQADSN